MASGNGAAAPTASEHEREVEEEDGEENVVLFKDLPFPSQDTECLYDKARRRLQGRGGEVLDGGMEAAELLRRAAMEGGHPAALWDHSSLRIIPPSRPSASPQPQQQLVFLDWANNLPLYRRWAKTGRALLHKYQRRATADPPPFQLEGEEAVRAVKAAIAIHGLAKSFHYGWGVKKDMRRVVRLLRLAIRFGYSLSEHGLGVCYDNGWGVRPSWTKALSLYRRAAEKDYCRSLYNLGTLYQYGESGDSHGRGAVQIDYEKALQYYRRAAEQGYYGAQCALGDCYLSGQLNLPIDQSQAFHYYQQAALQGDAAGQYNLARCYSLGVGVEKDETTAHKWYRKAAKQNHTEAINRLAWNYESGTGIPERNLHKALRIYKRSALSNGSSLALTYLHAKLRGEYRCCKKVYVVPSLFELCCETVAPFFHLQASPATTPTMTTTTNSPVVDEPKKDTRGFSLRGILSGEMEGEDDDDDDVDADDEEESEQQENEKQKENEGGKGREKATTKEKEKTTTVTTNVRIVMEGCEWLIPGDIVWKLEHQQRTKCEQLHCNRSVYKGLVRLCFRPKTSSSSSASSPCSASCCGPDDDDDDEADTERFHTRRREEERKRETKESKAERTNGGTGEEEEEAEDAFHMTFCGDSCAVEFLEAGEHQLDQLSSSSSSSSSPSSASSPSSP